MNGLDSRRHDATTRAQTRLIHCATHSTGRTLRFVFFSCSINTKPALFALFSPPPPFSFHMQRLCRLVANLTHTAVYHTGGTGFGGPRGLFRTSDQSIIGQPKKKQDRVLGIEGFKRYNRAEISALVEVQQELSSEDVTNLPLVRIYACREFRTHPVDRFSKPDQDDFTIK